MQRSSSDPTFVSNNHLAADIASHSLTSVATKCGNQRKNTSQNASEDSTSDSNSSSKQDSYTLSLEEKLQRVKENNSWNSEIEKIVKDIGEKAAGYQWMHAKAADFLGKISTWLTILYIIFNAIATFFLSTSLIAQLEAPWIYIPVGISAIVNIILTILAGAIKAMGIEDRVAKHKTAISNFSYLYFDTRKELSFYRRNRKHGPQYLDLVAQKFDFYILAGPDIPGRVENKYLKILRKEGRRLAVVGKISNEIAVQKDDVIPIKQKKKKKHHRKKSKPIDDNTEPVVEKDMPNFKGSMIYEMRRQNEAESESECESEPEGTSLVRTKQRLDEDDRFTRFQIDRFTGAY